MVSSMDEFVDDGKVQQLTADQRNILFADWLKSYWLPSLVKTLRDLSTAPQRLRYNLHCPLLFKCVPFEKKKLLRARQKPLWPQYMA